MSNSDSRGPATSSPSEKDGLVVRTGDIVRYHPITTLPDHRVVEVVGEPWQIASGHWLAPVQDVDGGRSTSAWLGALTPNNGPAKAPQKEGRRHG